MIELKSEELITIQEILRKHVGNAEVRVFGSRHKGNSKNFSDLDLVIVGNEKLDILDFAMLEEAFEESMLPFRVDVLDWHRISPEFRKHIEKSYSVLRL